MSEYPRPDFVRDGLNWKSLNGPWSFLFDDDDIGLMQGWHLQSLPTEVAVKSSSTPSGSKAANDAQSITAKIAAGTQELIQGNQPKRGEATTNKKREIQVPYVFQCPASGIEDKGVHEVFWYEREITDPRTEQDKQKGHRVLARFGAVDYEAKVWLGGHFVGGHRGGHVPFDIDITDEIARVSPQRLTLRVYDSAYDLTQPRGKQYWGAQPESIFYTPSGGIWQNVWLEVVPFVRIGDSSHGTVLRSNDIESGKLHADIRILSRPAGHKYSVELHVSLKGTSVSKTERVDLPRESGLVSLDADMKLSEEAKAQLGEPLLESFDDVQNNVVLWSPDDPALYDIDICLYDATPTLVDTIRTTVGMRSLSWDDGLFRINNKPHFQALFLDQGYWLDTFMTPPSSEALRTDIELAQKMGFNGCRKHQKVEDPIFHYWADRLGFLVWGEMANAYAFSPEYVERFDQEWREAVLRDINHPSVVAWTPVNESWAYTDLASNQTHRDHIKSLYYATKALDPTRPINDNCGWEHVQTDLTTFHDYSDADALTKTCASMKGILGPKANRPMFLSAIGKVPGSSHNESAPVICTEFGGINIAREAAGSNDQRDWGYTTAADPKDLLKRIEMMMTGIANPGLIGGFVYTQLTDIEQEVNGLYTPDRKPKLDADAVKQIVEDIRENYYQLHTT
ncbi:Beta-glucuronidase 1 [Stagonosporopsis vannaccii]|nr:Beta-glucuronidase 1 [Stagonosporopsis vannaccii]